MRALLFPTATKKKLKKGRSLLGFVFAEPPTVLLILIYIYIQYIYNYNKYSSSLYVQLFVLQYSLPHGSQHCLLSVQVQAVSTAMRDHAGQEVQKAGYVFHVWETNGS